MDNIMLPFAAGITGYYTEKNDLLSLEIRCLRLSQTTNFCITDKTVINTIKQGFSPILEDYLGDNVPGFSDAFMEMQSHPIPVDGEEREFNITDKVKMKFCWIPAGKAMLGSPKNEVKRNRDEEEREFETNGFWMGKYPVTQVQWERIMVADPSRFKGNNLPVERISWHQCQDFIKKCSVSGLQLPHENQWEYACRGGKGNKQPFYWGNELSGFEANCHGTLPYGANNRGAYLAKTTKVGSYEKIAPHPWGLCDMHGNVWEWCENSHTILASYRVIRGGGWSSRPENCRSAKSNLARFSYAGIDIGFRLIIC